MEDDSSPVFRISRPYRAQLLRNPKAVLVLASDDGNELVGISDLERIFVGERYEQSFAAGMLDRADRAEVIKPVVRASALSLPVAPNDEPAQADEDMSEPSSAVSDVLAKLAGAAVEPPEEAPAAHALHEPDPDGGEPAAVDATIEEDEKSDTATSSADEGKTIRRRRIKRG
jgi:hypothetical protein